MKAQLLGFWDKGRIVCVCGCSLLGGLSPSSFTEQLQLPPCRLLHIPASTCSANTAPQSCCKTLKFNFKWLQPVSSSHCKVITFFFWLFCFLRNNLKKKNLSNFLSLFPENIVGGVLCFFFFLVGNWVTYEIPQAAQNIYPVTAWGSTGSS